MKSIFFTLLTNRPVADNLKSNISKIKESQAVDARFKSTLEKYTGLNGGEFGRVDHMIPWQIDHQQTTTHNLLNNYQPLT